MSESFALVPPALCTHVIIMHAPLLGCVVLFQGQSPISFPPFAESFTKGPFSDLGSIHTRRRQHGGAVISLWPLTSETTIPTTNSVSTIQNNSQSIQTDNRLNSTALTNKILLPTPVPAQCQFSNTIHPSAKYFSFFFLGCL